MITEVVSSHAGASATTTTRYVVTACVVTWLDGAHAIYTHNVDSSTVVVGVVQVGLVF